MDRRQFIQTTCAAAGALKFGEVTVSGQPAASRLEQAFRNPGDDAGLSIVHHWTGGVVTKEGITADIEGMAAAGINTVNWFYFDGSGVQDGIQVHACKTPEWWELVDHLMSEARRVGLTLAPHVCSSWGPSGTDGITPELSAQILVCSEAEAEGGRPFTGSLAKAPRPAGRGRGGVPPVGAPAAGAGGGGRGGPGTAAVLELLLSGSGGPRIPNPRRLG